MVELALELGDQRGAIRRRGRRRALALVELALELGDQRGEAHQGKSARWSGSAAVLSPHKLADMCL